MSKNGIILSVIFVGVAGLGLLAYKAKSLLTTAKNLYWEIKGISGLKIVGTSLVFNIKLLLRSHSQTNINIKNIVVSLMSEDSQKSRSVVSTPFPVPKEYIIKYGDIVVEIPLEFNLVKIGLSALQQPTFIVAINAQVEGISLPQVEFGFTIKQVIDTAKNVVTSLFSFFTKTPATA